MPKTKQNPVMRPVHNGQKEERSNEALISEAMATLQGIPEATASLLFLKLLLKHKNAEWLKIKEPESYPYASKLYENRRWLTPKEERLPPGTTYLGIVLEKTLEVKAVHYLPHGANRENKNCKAVNLVMNF
jgi:hypothetical protein